MYRQGDLLIVSISKIPKGATPVSHRILAHGEATGHTHTLEDGLVFELEAGVLVFSLESETALVHQEHDKITLPAGDYEVIRQKEYSPKGVRYVQD